MTAVLTVIFKDGSQMEFDEADMEFEYMEQACGEFSGDYNRVVLKLKKGGAVISADDVRMLVLE